LFCVFNFSNQPANLTWYAFKANGKPAKNLFDHWEEKKYNVGKDDEYLIMEAYSFLLLEEKT
jgi:amylosucrase